MIIIAGPCSLESLEQTLQTAFHVKKCGATHFRGGVWKYRSDPTTFQGHGAEAIKWLKEVKKQTGLKIVTEVFNWHHIDEVEDVADIIQIGSRNAYNTDLIKAVSASGKPVLFKRHFAMSLGELIKHAEYIRHGNYMFCLRGIQSMFPQEQRFFPDIMDVLRLRNMTDKKIIYDVSHSGCDRQYIPSLVDAAMAFQPDGLMIEVHPDPDKSYSDPAQALSFEVFQQVMQKIIK